MRVKNLRIVNTEKITKVYRASNFDIHITSVANGYKIVEKKRVKPDYSIFKRKKYFLPGTDNLVTRYRCQNVGDIYMKGIPRPLWLYERRKEISNEELKVLEKRINKQGK